MTSHLVFRDRPSHDAGQATVEFALTLPLVVVCFSLLVQIAVVGATHLSVIDETRRVARSASIDADPSTGAHAAMSPRSPSALDVDIGIRTITVTVTRRVEIVIPLIGRVVPPIRVSARLTVAREPPLP